MRKVLRIVALSALAAVVALVVALQLKNPSHQRQWKTEYAVLAQAQVAGDQVTISNVRNFTYNADGSVRDPRYEDRTYDLSKLTTVWYGISHFFDYGLAHTFVSFGFEDGNYVTISIEARQEVSQTYSPLRGLLREYELIYVAADERDVVGVRSHVRDERVYLYQVIGAPEKAPRLFLAMLKIMNEIYEKPRFYNTLTDNCTTNILQHAERLSTLDLYLDYRALLPGYSDSLAYELGVIENGLSLPEVRARARIDPAAAAIDDPEFSRRIRKL
jgi:hypothetical protein